MAERAVCVDAEIEGRRSGERRQGLHAVVRGLADHLIHGDPQQPLPNVLAAHVARLMLAERATVVPAPRRPAGLLEPNRPGGRRLRGLVPGPGHAEAMTLDVELGDRAADAWDQQLVDTAAHLVALAMAADRGGPARRRDPRSPTGASPLVGSGTAMCSLRDRIERVAASDFTVLIEGESGTGKELVAHQIHDRGPRRGGPFVAVNCAALVETLLEAELFGIEDRTATGVRGRRGKFELADGGTIFLDEVADLSMPGQAKLLRAIQEVAVERVGGHGSKRLNVRIVAATNKPLSAQVDRGLFRPDLYYRLTGLAVPVPALRSRQEDIPELASYFVAGISDRARIVLSAAAVDALMAYAWPGNVRELQRTLEGAVVLARARIIDLEDLPPALRAPYTDVVAPSLESNDTLRIWASRYSRLVLERSGQNKRRACRALGISYHTLQAHLRYRRAPVARDHARDDVA